MSKKYTDKVNASYVYAMRDMNLTTLSFLVEEQGKFYVTCGKVRYAEFDTKQEADQYALKFNTAIAPVKTELSDYYNSLEEAIITGV